MSLSRHRGLAEAATLAIDTSHQERVWLTFAFLSHSGHGPESNGKSAAMLHKEIHSEMMNGTQNHAVANGRQGISNMYMPIKALNTFSRDWKI